MVPITPASKYPQHSLRNTAHPNIWSFTNLAQVAHLLKKYDRFELFKAPKVVTNNGWVRIKYWKYSYSYPLLISGYEYQMDIKLYNHICPEQI